ncbi:MAG: polyphosphate kinase 2 [Reichenbachiella sp.]|uniref:polyphosphate kinase 2 n=1 Tax=Reichenbachiella sp. TaxID=2184521 RepID=UPI003266CA98
MKPKSLTNEDVALINSKRGLEVLLSAKKVNISKLLEKTRYEEELRKVQAELIKLQTWVIKNNKKIVVIFEGRDAAGKGGAIRRIVEHLNPRHFRIVALNIPTEDEREQWFLQRYINKLPKPGEIVFFDRSWYNRAVVEPVNGFCSEQEYKTFMSQVNGYEQMLIDSGIFLIKFYFSITKKEQARRFNEIKKSPLKQWKMTPVDEKSQELWEDYTFYKDAMFKTTHTKEAPWIIIDANKKAEARLEAINNILKAIPFKYSLDD